MCSDGDTPSPAATQTLSVFNLYIWIKELGLLYAGEQGGKFS